jgi:site-specific recombinase XerD
LDEREQYIKYGNSDLLWLNRVGNPYKYYSLNRLLKKTCDSAEIRSDDRTWYSIRHSVGTYMTREEGLAATQAQLRYNSAQTTMRYDQAPVEDRQDALDRMG